MLQEAMKGRSRKIRGWERGCLWGWWWGKIIWVPRPLQGVTRKCSIKNPRHKLCQNPHRICNRRSMYKNQIIVGWIPENLRD
jgi:hypothetical protein